jgi:glycosyltransferase involved in cell wall biosynthesis
MLTAIVIARNSAATISACMQALGFCDRILVGENGSEDRTVDLARAAGGEVQTVAWEGYGRTKNRLLDQVAVGWVLSIDADEIVSPNLAREIQEAVSRPGDRVAFWLARQNYFLGRPIRHCGWNPDWQLRLVRAKAGRFEERAVHEAMQVLGPTGRLSTLLEHFTYPSLNDYLERLNRYTTLAAQDRRARGRRFSWLRLIFDPLWTWKKMYILKAGWKDGFAGFLLCALSGLNTLVKHAKLWEIQSASRTKT